MLFSLQLFFVSIGPLLSNLFLHYVFDVWMKRNYPMIPWCRYADDGLAHCKTLRQAEGLLIEMEKRFKACGLELHPDKTKIVFCKCAKMKYSKMEFDFLGFNFRRRLVKDMKTNRLFMGFTPSVSKSALKAMNKETRRWGFSKRTELNLKDIANLYNPVLRGWIQNYGNYGRSGLYPVLRHFNKTLVAWVMKKFKRLKRHKTKAVKFLLKISERQPQLFAHWKIGMAGAFT